MMIRVLVIVLVMSGCAYAEDYAESKQRADEFRRRTYYAELKQRADDYWLKIQQITAKEFGGFNLEVTVNTTYNFEETANSGKGVGVGLSMPIYSKKDRIDSRLKAMQFSEHGSELIMKYRQSISDDEITDRECNYLESIMGEYGVEAVKASFECKRRLAGCKVLTEKSERDIKMLIDPYLKKSNQVDVLKTGGQ